MLTVVLPPTQRPPSSATAPPAPPSISAKRIGQKRSCVAFASQRVKSAAVRCGPALEQEHAPAALGELAGDDAAAGAGADDDDVEALAHPMPRYDQSFASRVASGVLKSISAQAPVASTPGATKSL